MPPHGPAGTDPPHTVLVVGSLSLDTVLTKDKAVNKIGGVVTYGGLTFARHGVDTTAVINVAGADRSACRLHQTEGMRLFVGETARTTRFVNDIRGEQRLQTVPALAEPIRAGDIREALGGRAIAGRAAHVHLGLLHWHDVEESFLLELDDLGMTISADIQGFLRRPRREELVEEVSPLLERVLRSAAYVKASRGELSVVSASFALDESEMVREFGLRELLITEGEAGGVVIGADGEETRYEAGQNEREDLDTTGAGDVFFAAYLVHRLHNGESVAAASHRAAALATAHVHGRYITEESLLLPPTAAPPD